MTLESVLNDASVLELKRLANEALKKGPTGMVSRAPGSGYGGDGTQVPGPTPEFKFPQAWNSVWISARGKVLQDKIRARFGPITLIPLEDGRIAVSSHGTAPSGYDGEPSSVEQGELNVPHSANREFRQSIKRQNDTLMTIVAARQRATGKSFESCWNEIRLERPDLVQSTPTGGFMPSPSDI